MVARLFIFLHPNCYLRDYFHLSTRGERTEAAREGRLGKPPQLAKTSIVT
jgi:hypothetical protein